MRAFAVLSRHRRWTLLALLAVLHLVLVQGVESTTGRILLLGDIGLLLLWQPLIRAETRLGWVGLLIVAAGCAAVVRWASTPILMLWIMLLAGIIGGKVFFSEAWPSRLFYLLCLGYLVTALLVVVTPEILPGPSALPEPLPQLARVALPGLLAVMALLPKRDEEHGPAEVIDLIYSAFVVLLLAVLVLGCLALMLLGGRGYLESLLVALAVVSMVLFLLGWAWNPRAGYDGLGLLFSRHVLGGSLPFERWLDGLIEIARRESDPNGFLGAAAAALPDLPGVAGGRWGAPDAGGSFGAANGYSQTFRHGNVWIELLTRRPLTPAFTWHFDLLVQITGEFYLAKLGARQLEQLGYVRAVHETGARLTHDVKNLLQSLNTLCFAAGTHGDEPTPEFDRLLRRQLPAITQRLSDTLGKLSNPEPGAVRVQPLQDWWAELQRRHGEHGIRFATALPVPLTPIPADLFSGVADNLVANALNKRSAHPGLEIGVTLEHAGMTVLTVCDSGDAVPPALGAVLFREPVPSAGGLGIGLYHGARHAEALGYRLRLSENRPGRVCLRLEPAV